MSPKQNSENSDKYLHTYIKYSINNTTSVSFFSFQTLIEQGFEELVHESGVFRVDVRFRVVESAIIKHELDIVHE